MARKPTGLIVVTGMHRSGTTLLGRILSLYPGLHVIHEPLNREFGMRGVRHVYPCDMRDEQGAFYIGLLDRLLEGHAGYVRRASREPWPKAAVRAVIGGRTGFDMALYRIRKVLSPSLTPVFKDPFAVLLSRSLIERQGRVIVLMRHPAATWLSVKRMGWQFH
jgi:hypothetical protein